MRRPQYANVVGAVDAAFADASRGANCAIVSATVRCRRRPILMNGPFFDLIAPTPNASPCVATPLPIKLLIRRLPHRQANVGGATMRDPPMPGALEALVYQKAASV